MNRSKLLVFGLLALSSAGCDMMKGSPKPESLEGSWRAVCSYRVTGLAASPEPSKEESAELSVTVKKSGEQYSVTAKIGAATACTGDAAGKVIPKNPAVADSKDLAAIEIVSAVCNPFLGNSGIGNGPMTISTSGDTVGFSAYPGGTNGKIELSSSTCKLAK